MTERHRLSGFGKLADESIRSAVEEFLEMGQRDFLARYDLAAADRYVILERGEEVDAKAVLHVAWQKDHPGYELLRSGAVRGDRRSVADPLRQLGFVVVNTKEDRPDEAPLGTERTPAEYVAAIAEAVAPLDQRTATMARGEQQLLRGALGLLQVETHSCELCDRHLPTELLVAAHIKRRAACEHRERLDAANVVMRACALGCDALFERGYLAVDGTGVLRSLRPPTTASLAAHVAPLVGRAVDAHRPGREGYFAWHRHLHATSDGGARG